MHVLILELFICFLQIIFSMSQTTAANSLSGPFSIILGLSFKLCNRFCFPWIWLFYLLEEISMFNDLSFKQLRYYRDTDSILIPCIKWRFMSKFVCHKRLSIISKVPDKLKFSSIFFQLYLLYFRACLFCVGLNLRPLDRNDTSEVWPFHAHFNSTSSKVPLMLHACKILLP